MSPFTIAVASGKGGTGKTTISVALASALPGARLLDCDVEAPDCHLFLDDLRIEEVREVPVMVPVLDPERCDGCEDLETPVCREVCEFGAIAVIARRAFVYPNLCHGCGACVDLCPRVAFAEGRKVVGEVSTGRFGNHFFAMGRLTLAEPSAGPVIRAVKRHLPEQGTAVIDCPPGVACPVVEALHGVSACLLVTEPTPFGLHDLKLAVEIVRELSIPAGVVLNRADVGDTGVRDFCREAGVPILIEIPLDRGIAEAGARGRPLLDVRPEYGPPLVEAAEALRERAAVAGRPA